MKTQARGNNRQPAGHSRSELLAQLDAAVARLIATCRAAPDDSRRGAGEWTLHDVLAHIRFWHGIFAR